MHDRNSTSAGDQPLTLGIPGFTYADLYAPEALARLALCFDEALAAADPELFTRFQAYRKTEGAGADPLIVSELLLGVAPHVANFLGRLFGIEEARAAQQQAIQQEISTIFAYAEKMVTPCRKAHGKGATAVGDSATHLRTFTALSQVAAPPLQGDAELAFCSVAATLLDLRERLAAAPALRQAQGERGGRLRAEALALDLRKRLQAQGTATGSLAAALAAPDPLGLVIGLLEEARNFTLAALGDPAVAACVSGWASFRTPAKVDFEDLVHHATEELATHSAWTAEPQHLRRRDGFGLTDPRASEREVLHEVDRCLYCHDRDTDSCSKGMRNKKTGELRKDPLGTVLTGCPLCERISEMHLLKRAGDNLAALAMIMVDNPMCPGTGHRICNDCMKACIYQRFEPVNIPQIETNVLMDVFSLPWGYEIYALLTRWDPLNVKRPFALPYNGRNVMVVGLGPAGYTLAHYLLNEGFGVVAVEALKVEPLPPHLTGVAGVCPAPIRDIRAHWEPLDLRIPAGFGGVAEYGITVRWDKNFLKVIQLTLARRAAFRAFANVRFGSTLTAEAAWGLGFHHIALATGAGKPSIIGLKNNLLPGIRKASDFLMALQLSGAAKRSSLANLQCRLPAGIIGGGLTAVDAATEILAYYPVQVEKTLERYERVTARYGREVVRGRFDAEELHILDEFLAHGTAISAERARAEASGERPDFLPLLRGWGGVTLFYRKGMRDSPAYRDNPEELVKALEEGIGLAEGMAPLEAVPNDHGALQAVVFDRHTLEEGRWVSAGQTVTVPMHTLFIAAGTSPNTLYEQEHPGTFALDGKYFRRHAYARDHEPHLIPVADPGPVKVARPGFFTSYEKDGHYISFYGDNHPTYAGNVVKAMASAKDGYPHVVALFAKDLAALDPRQQPERDAKLASFFGDLEHAMQAEVVSIQRLTPTIVEAVVRAPLRTQGFHPGQFYRVQNLEAHAPMVIDTKMATEGLALTGAWVDPKAGLLSLIALEVGGSSRLLSQWEPGDRVALMGPTGAPTEIPTGETILLIGGGLGNAVLLSIGLAMQAAGNRVLYVAGYRAPQDVFKREQIEAAANTILWTVDPGPGVTAIPVGRVSDKTYVGNVLQALVAYAKGEMGEVAISLADVDRMLVIGSDRMMAAVTAARHGVLAPYLKAHHEAIGSINSPMQCMMKGICAQCLCRQVDPATGKESFVYTCFNQDQPLDKVDFAHLSGRLRQNTVLEKLANLWVDHLLDPPAAD